MSDIRYTFTATGHTDVIRAFETISQAARASSRAVSAAAVKTAATQEMAAKRLAKIARGSNLEMVQATKAAVGARSRATITALQKERGILRQLLAEHEGFEKRRTRVAEREGQKRVTTERRQRRRASAVGRFGGRIMRTVGSFAAMGAGIALAGGVGLAVRENVRIEDTARDIAIRGRGPGKERINPRDIADQARRTALEVPGAKTTDILAGTSAFLERTGDLKKAQEASKIIAEIAIASGSDMENIANSAAALFMQFGTGEKNIEGLREQLSLFVLQGKKGAFEMRDMSKGIERLAASAKTLGVRGDIKQVATIGALAQFARRAAGGPERATTALEGMFSTMMRKRGLIKKRYGIDVGEESQKDLAATLPKLFKAIGGDAEKLGNIFEKRAVTGVIDLFNEFKKLEKETGSQSEAAKQLTEKIRDMADAEDAAKELSLDLADAQKSAGARLDAAWERIVQVFGTGAGIEAINSFIDTLPVLAEAAPAFAGILKLLIEAVTGAVLGIAKMLSLLPGETGRDFTAILEGLEKGQAVSGARASMTGHEQQGAAARKQLLEEYGLTPADVKGGVPVSFAGTPEEKRIKLLAGGAETAERMRGEEYDRLRTLGGLTPEEQAADEAKRLDEQRRLSKAIKPEATDVETEIAALAADARGQMKGKAAKEPMGLGEFLTSIPNMWPEAVMTGIEGVSKTAESSGMTEAVLQTMEAIGDSSQSTKDFAGAMSQATDSVQAFLDMLGQASVPPGSVNPYLP